MPQPKSIRFFEESPSLSFELDFTVDDEKRTNCDIDTVYTNPYEDSSIIVSQNSIENAL